MFNSHRYFNSRGDGHPVLEILPAPATTGQTAPGFFVPLRSSRMTGSITGPLATLTLTQTFAYSKSEFPAIIEALYRFPLPGDASVTGVKVKFGQVSIETLLKPRESAQSDYDKARDEGRQAVFMTRESPDVFTLAINGIKPDEPVEIETSFVQMAKSTGKGWSLRIPLTTAPRFVRPDESGQRQAGGQPLWPMRDPGHHFSMQLQINRAGQISAPGIDLALNKFETFTEITLAGNEIVPNRDLVLQWEDLNSTELNGFQIFSWTDPEDNFTYFLSGIAAPSSPSGKIIPREIIILVDHSGSMEGAKWAAADWAVKAFLNQLLPEDRFNLGIFHDYTNWWASEPTPASAQNTQSAIAYLDSHKDSGGTELGMALEQALAMPRQPGDTARHVLLITDAEVSDSSRILSMVDTEQNSPFKRRISVLCIDSAPNALLAGEIADRSGGISVFLTSNPSEEDITSSLDDILDGFARPVYSDAILEVRARGLEASRQAVLESSEEQWMAIDIGDIPAGIHRWTCGRFLASAHTMVRFELAATGLETPVALDKDLNEQMPAGHSIKALFGAGRLLVLEQLRGAGLDSQEVSNVLKRLGYLNASGPTEDHGKRKWRYTENEAQMLNTLVTRLLGEESMHYGLLSSETAFAAVRSECGLKSEYSVLVPSATPQGWDMPLFSQHLAPSPIPCAPGPGNNVFRADVTAAMPTMAAPKTSKLRSRISGMMQAIKTDIPDFGARAESGLAPLAEEIRSTSPEIVAFSGRITLQNGEETILDSQIPGTLPKHWDSIPDYLTLRRLELTFLGTPPNPAELDRNTVLLLYCADEAVPASRIRIAELIRQGGQRPLNISWNKTQVLRLVIQDPSGILNYLECEIRLAW